MRFGLSDSEYLFLFENLVAPLKAKEARVFLFGSRATGKFKKFSDIDLLFQESSKPIRNAEIYLLLSSIEESAFPYKIDLVRSTELAQSYRASVERDKIEL
jgi:predicted nucleotidyltransferase